HVQRLLHLPEQRHEPHALQHSHPRPQQSALLARADHRCPRHGLRSGLPRRASLVARPRLLHCPHRSDHGHLGRRLGLAEQAASSRGGQGRH
ncbi:hypothetical protein BN1708_019059, partial [Verticillium longisporum]